MPRRISQNVSLTPELGRFIQAEVASGRYQTASEVIRDGLRLLQERNQAHPPTDPAVPADGHER